MEETRQICREGGEGSYFQEVPRYLNEDDKSHDSLIDEVIRSVSGRNHGGTHGR